MDFRGVICFFFFQNKDGLRDKHVNGVKTLDLPSREIFWGLGPNIGPHPHPPVPPPVGSGFGGRKADFGRLKRWEGLGGGRKCLGF